MMYSNNSCFNSFVIRSVFFIYIIFSLINPGYSQGQTEIIINPEGDTVLIHPIPVQDINSRFEENNTRFNKTLEVVKLNKDIYALDTIVQYASDLLDKEQLRIKDEEQQLTIRNIDDLKRQWGGYDAILTKWQATLTTRIVELEKEFFEIDKITRTWNLTKKAAKEQKGSQTTIDRIDEIIIRSRSLENDIKFRQDSVLILQNKITDFQIQVTGVISVLDEKRKSLQSEYFTKESPYIWQLNDSTVSTTSLPEQFKNSLNHNIDLIETFISANENKAKSHLVITVLLLLFFFGLYRSSKSSEKNEDEKPGWNNQIILSKFYASALLVAFLFSLVIYANIPNVVREFVRILMLIPALFLIPGLIDKKLLRYFYYLVVLFLFDEILVFFDETTFSVRLLTISELLLTMWLVNSFGNQVRKESIKIDKKAFRQAIIIFRPIYIFFLSIAVFGNIFGYVNLSVIILGTVISSILVAVLLALVIVIANTLFYSLFHTRLFQLLNIIKRKGLKLQLKIQSLIFYIAIFIWIRAIFISLGLADQFGNWLMGIMEVKWELRSAVISFGGIISFFLVILVTSLLTKFLKILMEEEIFPRVKLARGVPGAISMVVRYTVVAFGIYIAISAIGVDLDKFGFIAGALGVGIGFGLQGVVYNFIAGLILSFERPIQKGDTIEIGTLMGDVTNIGVRASTVRTYDGSEVIVPNGNLISKELVNWTLSDRRKRRVVPVSVAYGSKPREVMEILFKTASEHPEVLSFPKPWPLFDGFGDSALKFRVLFWVDFDRGLTVQSEVAVNIYDALEAAGIQIPFPQQDINIKSFDPTIQKIVFPGSDIEKEK